MSKLLRTFIPLIATLNTRCPEAVQVSSAKCNRTAKVCARSKPGNGVGEGPSPAAGLLDSGGRGVIGMRGADGIAGRC